MGFQQTNAREQIGAFYPRPYAFAGPTMRRNHGMGDQATSITASVLGGAAQIPSPASPFLALGATLVSLFGQIFSGCGQTCTLTSDMANKLEQFLQQNITLYFSSGRTQSEQAAALANFNNFWGQLTQYCGQASMGSAGQNCIGDRQAGACKWKASPPYWNGCSYSGAGASGSGSSCWNWWIGYHDPIANDPCVVPDPVAPQTFTTLNSAGQAVTTQTPAGSSILGLSLPTLSTPMLLGGGAALLGLILFMGSSR